MNKQEQKLQELGFTRKTLIMPICQLDNIRILLDALKMHYTSEYDCTSVIGKSLDRISEECKKD